ncbi:MAG TPA: type 1 glutamine amidotransferase [Polyangiaceae bacterium]
MKDGRVIVLQHAAPEEPGLIAHALEARDLPIRGVRTFAGERIPENVDEVLGLVVMGGPMGVGDAERLPYLRQEMKLIEQAVKAGCPVIGVCLGSQLLAHVLGARVIKGPRKEIGWHRVTLTDDGLTDAVFKGAESSFVAFHWHGDIFSLPQGATSLASSELTTHQAFRYGTSAYGVLFHLEITPEILKGMVTSFADELSEVGAKPQSLLSASEEHLAPLAERGARAFAVWADLVATRRDENP